MKQFVLLIGANSDIAKALATTYAMHGYNLYLVARNSERLYDFASDIQIRYDIQVECLTFDVLDYTSHQKFYDKLPVNPIGAIAVAGYLGDQQQAQCDFKEAQAIINTNYTGIVSILNTIANDFEKRQEGFIIGISSVAGDRGRANNYLYGSAKAGLSTYLSGLRNRLYKSNIQVLTVKPGFVATHMTRHLTLPKRLTATPKQVANDIYKAQQRGKNIIYTKWIWHWIMFIIKLIPEPLFKKTHI